MAGTGRNYICIFVRASVSKLLVPTKKKTDLGRTTAEAHKQWRQRQNKNASSHLLNCLISSMTYTIFEQTAVGSQVCWKLYLAREKREDETKKWEKSYLSGQVSGQDDGSTLNFSWKKLKNLECFTVGKQRSAAWWEEGGAQKRGKTWEKLGGRQQVNRGDTRGTCILARRGALEHFLLELALEDHWQQGQHGKDGQHGHGPPGDCVSGRAQLMQRGAGLDGYKRWRCHTYKCA